MLQITMTFEKLHHQLCFPKQWVSHLEEAHNTNSHGTAIIALFRRIDNS